MCIRDSFYTSGGKEVKFQYTTMEESNVDVTLQVYKTATPVSYTHLDVYKRQVLEDVHQPYQLLDTSKNAINIAEEPVFCGICRF